MANGCVGGYASVFIATAATTVSIDGSGIDPALAVSMIPNTAMAHAALTAVAHLREGESVLVHGALGGGASAFPAIAKHLGASHIVGTVLPGKLDAARSTRLPCDQVVDFTRLAEELGEEKFDLVIDPVGQVRTQILALMPPGGRLIAAGNASSDGEHTVNDNQLWLGSVTIAGFNAGAFLPTHPDLMQPALQAARTVIAAGLGETEVETLPLSEAAHAHQRMEDRDVAGRLVLSPQA